MATVTINQSEVSIKEWQGNRVVTFKDIDLVHGRPDGTARKRFNDNKERFIENVDYFMIKRSDNQMSEKRTLGFEVPNRGLTLITESGYLMLVKSFTDDLAWDVQRQLVNLYFRVQSQTAIVPVENDMPVLPSRLVVRTYKGKKVVTSVDLAYYFGVTTDSIRYYAHTYFEKDTDYYCLQGYDLLEFKSQNMGAGRFSKHLYVFTQSGFVKLSENYGFDDNNDLLAVYNANDTIREASNSSAHEELMISFENLTVEELHKVHEFLVEMKKARYMRIDKSISTICLNLVRINDLIKLFTAEDFDADAREKYSVTMDGLLGFGFELFNEIQNLKKE